MHPDLDDAIVRDFPRLFRLRHERSGGPRYAISFGFAVEDGWEPLVRRLAEKLEPIARQTNLRAVQVKEKYAELCFYVTYAELPDDVAEMVGTAIEATESESRRTCECCGAPGETRDLEGWWLTACAPCREREQARRAERNRRWREAAPRATRQVTCK